MVDRLCLGAFRLRRRLVIQLPLPRLSFSPIFILLKTPPYTRSRSSHFPSDMNSVAVNDQIHYSPGKRLSWFLFGMESNPLDATVAYYVNKSFYYAPSLCSFPNAAPLVSVGHLISCPFSQQCLKWVAGLSERTCRFPVTSCKPSRAAYHGTEFCLCHLSRSSCHHVCLHHFNHWLGHFHFGQP